MNTQRQPEVLVCTHRGLMANQGLPGGHHAGRGDSAIWHRWPQAKKEWRKPRVAVMWWGRTQEMTGKELGGSPLYPRSLADSHIPGGTHITGLAVQTGGWKQGSVKKQEERAPRACACWNRLGIRG